MAGAPETAVLRHTKEDPSFQSQLELMGWRVSRTGLTTVSRWLNWVPTFFLSSLL